MDVVLIFIFLSSLVVDFFFFFFFISESCLIPSSQTILLVIPHRVEIQAKKCWKKIPDNILPIILRDVC